MSTQPFLPLFFGDLLASTPTWDGEERALYIMLLAYQWTAGAIPSDPKRIAKMCQYEFKPFLRLWETVGKKFIAEGNGLINPRLEEHRERAVEISTVRSGVGRAGGIASAEARRKAKLKQGTKQMPTKIEPIASDLPQQNSTILSNPSQSNPEEDSRRGEDPVVGTLKTQIFRLAKQLNIDGGVITNELKAHSETEVWQALGATLKAKPGETLPYFRGCLKPQDGAESRREFA